MGQIGIEQILTNNIMTLNGEQKVPTVGKDGEHGPIALISDIQNVKNYLESKIEEISITGSFTPVAITCAVSSNIINILNDTKNIILNNLINKENEINEKIKNTNEKIDVIQNIITDLPNKYSTHENLKELNKKIDNVITLSETNKKGINEKISFIINTYPTKEDVKKIENSVKTTLDNTTSNINSSLNSKTEQININLQNQITELQSDNNIKSKEIEQLKKEVNNLTNQNKEFMKALLSINKKLNGV